MSLDETQGWFRFLTNSASGAEFKVAAFKGSESLGRPYSFDIDLVTNRYDLDFDALLGSTAALYISPAGADDFYYHGIITHLEAHFEVVEEKLLIKVRLEPTLVQLRDCTFNEAFIDNADGLSLADLINSVLQRIGLQGGRDYEIKLSPPVRRRSFIMQYQESSLSFLHRWLEFEGAYYYFEQTENCEKIIFIDRITSLPAQTNELKYRPVGMYETELYQTSLQVFNERQTLVPGKSILQDYNYRRASDMVKTEQQDPKMEWGAVMRFGSDSRDEGEAKHYANLRLESQLISGHLLKGEGLVSGLRSGIGISVEGHPRKSLNSEYRLVSVTHEGAQTGFGLAIVDEQGEKADNFYRSSFDAIPKGVEYRLPLEHPRPKVTGYLPGFIDAAGAGQVAEVDRYGRYKVDLPFDYTDHNAANASAWVRLATPYGGMGLGKETGLHFPLLKGAEVVLTFMDGDPDQPVIVGVLPNSLTPSTVNSNNNTLNRMVSTSSNELHLDDTPGTQGIRMRSSNGSAMFMLGSFGGQFGNLLPEEIGDIDESQN